MEKKIPNFSECYSTLSRSITKTSQPNFREAVFLLSQFCLWLQSFPQRFAQVNYIWLWFITYPVAYFAWRFCYWRQRACSKKPKPPLPAEAEQLRSSWSGEVDLTLALSSPCWKKDIKPGWHDSSASGGILLSHVFVWVHSLIRCAPKQEAGSQ